ncbi:MAG: tyrosine--tRNA ligase [Candidatus Paceibacterota bacterium]|jgi:tyrosyl-tRNA synthetase
MKIDTDPKKIEDFLTRGVENIFPNKEFVKKQLLSGKKLKMYLGIDPTGPTLHLGHAVPLKKLKEFQALGHQVILLIGDFTGMIGDPSDKNSTRKQLTRKEVLNNCKLYKKQASLFLKFGFGGAKLKYNSTWLGKMKFGDVLSLASKMTVDQMLKRDMFQKRIEANKPIHIHEFMYPLMQGYDSFVLNVEGEIGGNDQMFNMLTGRDLLKEISGKEKFVITTKLLEDANGKKMGKTDGNAVSMLDDEFEMYGKVMSWTDGMMLPAFEISTDVSMEKMAEIKEQLEKGINPREIKGILAREIVKVYYGEKRAQKAEENFIATFKKGGIPEDIQEIKIEKGSGLCNAVVSNKIVPSNTEFRRLITAGAISDMKTGEKITDPNFKIESEIVLKIGKKTFVKILV